MSYSAIVMISSLVEDVKHEIPALFQLTAVSSRLSAVSIGRRAENTTVSMCCRSKEQPQPQQRRTRVSDLHGLNPLIAEWAMSEAHGRFEFSLGVTSNR